MRSILPHEPLPSSGLGYINIQGLFIPKQNSKKKSKDSDKKSDEKKEETKEDYKKKAEEITLKLTTALNELPISHKLQSLDVYQCCTKVKLTYGTPSISREITNFLRHNRITPSDLLLPLLSDEEVSNNLKYSTKALQVNQLTDVPLPQEAWKFASPPKFRRLLPTPENEKTLDSHKIEELRSTTRFVYLSGLVDEDCDDLMKLFESVMRSGTKDAKGQDGIILDALREVLNPFDSTGHGVELWLPNKKKKIGTAQYCYIGMRSHTDAESLILKLQNKQINLCFETFVKGRMKKISLPTQNLFLDWADVSRRTYKNDKNNPSNEKQNTGLPSKSECTSTTESIHIPGLALIPNFITSEQEEKVILAAITGPNAPWAPKQKRQSGNEPVKRRVQHYGYVFEYATADVIRKRDPDYIAGGGGCPLLPAISRKVITDLDVEKFINDSTESLEGWNVFAGIVERTRRTDFSPFLMKSSNESSDDNGKDDPLLFPNINQVTINEYVPGQGIGSHIDTPSAFGNGLISVTLHGGCVMEFRKKNESEQNKDKVTRKLVYLPARSALLMSGPARYEWEHMIVNRRTDTVNGVVIPRKLRVSLTLRTALEETEYSNATPLEIIESSIFPPQWYNPISYDICDRDEKNRQDLITPECEKNHVHAVYDAIAEQWHHTRGKRGVLWPGAAEFLDNLPRGSIVADVGCGDGKYFAAGWAAGCYVIGTDISLPLLQTAMGRTGGADPRQVKYDESGASNKPAMAVADCLNLPMRDGCCDAAICIAVMHHLSSEGRRLQCLRELRRVVKEGGLINVQAWAMEQEAKSKRKFAGSDVFVPFNAQPRFLNKVQVEKKKEMKKEGDLKSKGVAEMYSEAYDGAEFDENKGLVVFKRYCHLYRYGELDELVKQVEGLTLIQSGYESGNHFVLVRVSSVKFNT